MNVISENLKNVFLTTHVGMKVMLTVAGAAVALDQVFTRVQLSFLQQAIILEVRERFLESETRMEERLRENDVRMDEKLQKRDDRMEEKLQKRYELTEEKLQKRDERMEDKLKRIEEVLVQKLSPKQTGF